MSIRSLPKQTIEEALSSDLVTKQLVADLILLLSQLTQIIEDSGAPTFKAEKHTWYLDTATNKYYRNVDGGTTWVALN